MLLKGKFCLFKDEPFLTIACLILGTRLQKFLMVMVGYISSSTLPSATNEPLVTWPVMMSGAQTQKHAHITKGMNGPSKKSKLRATKTLESWTTWAIINSRVLPGVLADKLV